MRAATIDDDTFQPTHEGKCTMFRTLGRFCYGLSAASILLSIGTQFRMTEVNSARTQWFFQRRPPTSARSERQSIFFGLWAPTFAIVGKILEDMGREAEMRQALDTVSQEPLSTNNIGHSEQQVAGTR
jgi:hypothetical protein